MEKSDRKLSSIKNIDVQPKDIIFPGLIAEIVYLIGMLGINPQTDRVAFMFDEIKLAGLIAIPIIFFFVGLFLITWPIKFSILIEETKNPVEVYYKFKSRKERSIEISKLELVLSDKTIQLDNKHFGKLQEIKKSFSDYQLLATIELESIIDYTNLEFRLNYIDKGQLKVRIVTFRDIEFRSEQGVGEPASQGPAQEREGGPESRKQ